MTLKIKIEVPATVVAEGGASEYVTAALQALGYEKQRGLHFAEPTRLTDVGGDTLAPAPAPASPPPPPPPPPRSPSVTAPEAPKRRGRPPKTAAEAPVDTPPARGISDDPENRINPDDEADESASAIAEDTKAAADQDRIDESAETAKPVVLTVDDVRAAIGTYVNAYGMAHAVEDGKLILKEALGEPPAGEEFWRMSMIPDDQNTLARVIAVVERAVRENPLNRKKVAG